MLWVTPLDRAHRQRIDPRQRLRTSALIYDRTVPAAIDRQCPRVPRIGPRVRRFHHDLASATRNPESPARSQSRYFRPVRSQTGWHITLRSTGSHPAAFPKAVATTCVAAGSVADLLSPGPPQPTPHSYPRNACPLPAFVFTGSPGSTSGPVIVSPAFSTYGEASSGVIPSAACRNRIVDVLLRHRLHRHARRQHIVLDRRQCCCTPPPRDRNRNHPVLPAGRPISQVKDRRVITPHRRRPRVRRQRHRQHARPAPIVPDVLPAATDCPPAVVNAPQLTTTDPVAGVPFALYTVSCTVVVASCAIASITRRRHHALPTAPTASTLALFRS